MIIGLMTVAGAAIAMAQQVPVPDVPAAQLPDGVSPAEEVAAPYSSMALGLEWGGVAVQDEGHTVWGAAPIVDESGMVHLFVARWPERNVDPAWRKSSEIAHYVADQPEGPFTFMDVAVTGTGMDGAWDRYAPHNPEIQKFGDTYALLYIANSDYHQPPHPLNQAIGMRVSKSLDGPWRKVVDDGLVLKASDDADHWTHGRQVVNPAIVQVGDKFHLYFKSSAKHLRGPQYGLAIADHLEGPYQMTERPITGAGVVLEDASAFVWDGQVCLLTTDNHGHMTGIPGGGTLWVSEDGGRSFPTELAQVGYGHLTSYYPDYDPDKGQRVYGSQPKMERPKVLMIGGKPAYLYGPSGWALHGGDRTAAYVLKINLPQSAGPMPAVARSTDPVKLAKPTPAQLAWQKAELGVVFHYDLHVFDEEHYQQQRNRGTDRKDLDIFNPKLLSTDQWVETAKAMGARFAILTASHETGFRLWQSDVNPYSLRSTKWGGGKRDIVAEFVASCRKYGLEPGIYMGTRWNGHLGVLDFKVTERSTITQQEYNRLIEAEVAEICSRYGDLFELWFDGGAHGPKAGGPDVLSVFEKYQPDCLFYHNYQRADARWGGSESGTVPYPCWARLPFADGYEGHREQSHADGFKLLKQGDSDGTSWCPAMSDAPLRSHEWFWDAGDDGKIKPLKQLVDMYMNSVGRNSTLIVGLTPDARGLMPDADVQRCKEWGDAIRRAFRDCVGQTSGQGQELTLTLSTPATFDGIVLQEDIRAGERVRKYVVEAMRDGAWQEVASGSCIGQKHIHRLATSVTAAQIRLRITDSVATPLILDFALYNIPQ
ncbi:MAG: alpha-L-fucosidase [Planctomycetota bacterium]|jgi:alpha-L-fucosidase